MYLYDCLQPFLTRGITCTLLLGGFSASLVFADADTAPSNASDDNTIVVTATREARDKSTLSEAVSTFTEKAIDFVVPAHPSELLNKSAGVHVNNLGGEGHMTSIRQPISTGGVYLYLEDGIPIRPTGFFNHNALYEINMPLAHRVEVTKGPGSALYGSDAIGGIINVITKSGAEEHALDISQEIGSFGWKRLLLNTTGTGFGDTQYNFGFNLTQSDGYRDESGHERYSMNLRTDGFYNDQLKYKAMLSFTQVNQKGLSSLGEEDYLNRPTKNFYHNDVGGRSVNALRGSVDLSYQREATDLFSVTPYFRNNQMELMPSWMLSYDPNESKTNFSSVGALLKYRKNIPHLDLTWISGWDVDYTVANYEEQELSVGEMCNEYIELSAECFYTNTQATGRVNYDFDADQLAIAPYAHLEWVHGNLTLSAGLRYDYFWVDYSDNLEASVDEGRHLRPETQDVSYASWSPKLGAVLDIVPSRQQVYANYRHAFRVPSVRQLFRSGSTANTADLKEISADSLEIGWRGKYLEALRWDLAAYQLLVKNDIVSYIDDITNDRRLANAGETKHRGLELGFELDISEDAQLHTAWTVTKQKYEAFTVVYGYPAMEEDFAGNKVPKAPSYLGNMALTYRPAFLKSAEIEVEWEHVGEYYTDESNTDTYDGHSLWNARFNYMYNEMVSINMRLLNLADARYSTYTSKRVGSDAIQYRPGLPRTLYVTVKTSF